MGEKKEKRAARVINLEQVRKERARAQRREENRKDPLNRRILKLCIVVVFVLAGAFAAANWESINLDGLRRAVTYGNTPKTEDARSFSYDRGSENGFAVLRSSLVFVSNKEVTVYNHEGKKRFTESVKMDTPAIAVGTNTAAAYDIGGEEVLIFNEQGKSARPELAEGFTVLSASLNRSDFLALVGQKKNQKCCVIVYNEDREKLFEYESSSRFVTCAYVTEDCRYLIVQTPGQNNGIFSSELSIFRLDREERYGGVSLENSMVLSIGAVRNTTLCIAEDRAVTIGAGGEIGAEYRYDPTHLRGFSDAGDGFAVFLLKRHRAGTGGKIVTVGAECKVLHQIDLTDEVLDLSVTGRYIGVLYPNRLTIYNRDLSEYATFTQMESVQKVCMQQDGSAWLISSDEIAFLVP